MNPKLALVNSYSKNYRIPTAKWVCFCVYIDIFTIGFKQAYILRSINAGQSRKHMDMGGKPERSNMVNYHPIM